MTMKLAIFDVNNAACSLAVCPNGYSLMVDCGCHNEKACPVDTIHSLKSGFLGMKQYNGYDLTLLHITHPDDDHVGNAVKIKEKLPPYLLHRRQHEEFPITENIHDDYKKHIDLKYRGNPIGFTFGFDQNKTFQIPMNTILKDEELSKKVKNNSSILRFIEYGGKKVLFGGDLEKTGWDWLAKNHQDFVNTMKNGLDFLIAPHHGHKSGFPTSLFDLISKVEISILSKASESEKEDTDVSSQYSQYSKGVFYTNLNDNQRYFADGTLTTRSNGNIFLTISKEGNINIFTQKASSNHTKI
ncbi:MAG: MBL fold metallo-hydrolase [Parcubacteria group bacterium]